MSMRRFLAGGLLAGLMMSVVVFAPAAQARPVAQSTTCKMKSTATFNPGLNLNQEKVVVIKVKGKLSGCAGGGVTGAAFKGKGGGTISCTSGTATVKLKGTWNTGETSTISLTVDLGAQSLSGTVTAGKFAGEDVTATNVALTPIDGNCITSPLTKAKVTATLSL
jgi:hypothetical protein